MPFVGRGTDVQALQRAYESTDTATVVISGEGGIGKTRLVQELIRRADAPSVWIACFQLAGEPVAFSALLRALEPLSPPAPENLSIAGTSAQLRHFERWLTGLLSIAGGARAVLVVDDAH